MVCGVEVEYSAQTGCDRFIVKGCNWYGRANGALTRTIIQNPNLEATMNVIHSLIVDGQELQLGVTAESGNSRLLRGNVFSGEEVPVSTIHQFDNYLLGYNGAINNPVGG